MMDWTDRHCRFLHRQLTRCALLYTEMVVADAVIHGHRERLLGFDPLEQHKLRPAAGPRRHVLPIQLASLSFGCILVRGSWRGKGHIASPSLSRMATKGECDLAET